MTKSLKNVKFVWKFWKWDFQFSTRFIKFPALFIFGVTLTSLVTLTFDLEIRNFHTIFLVMLAICVHEFNRIQVFFLDKNHLKTPKVMTLTFDLENEKRPYSIKLWCIRYLNGKFDGYILKNVDVANLDITLLQRRKKLQWPLVTLTFDICPPKETCALPGMCFMFVPNMKLVGPMVFEELAIGHTYIHTEAFTLLII